MKEELFKFQVNELTECEIYKRLAGRMRGENRKILEKIAEDEFRHAGILEKITGRKASPNKYKIWFYVFLSYIFGITFAIKLMERGEEAAERGYEKFVSVYPEIKSIIDDEFSHEKALVNLIEEERIKYIGSMVLGLNDALVELTGSLAGFAFALRKSDVIGVAGFIVGVSAALSMAASEYLSKKSEGEDSPLKAAVYTGIAYIITVFFLVFPFFLIPHWFIAFLFSLVNVVLIIYLFSFFVSVVKEISFKHTFREMMFISMGVAVISFIIGIMARKVFGIELT